MVEYNDTVWRAGIFITFPGNCRMALSLYQRCFGGRLHLETFKQALPGYTGKPVVSGSLLSERVIIHGSDLVHEEGRIPGNYISVFLQCKNAHERYALIKKLHPGKKNDPDRNYDDQLVEITDAFEVRWVLGV